RHDLVLPHEALGIVPGVGEARQPAELVGDQQAERVPPVAAPGLADVAPLEQDVLQALLLEMPAGCEAGLTGADDHGFVHFVHAVQPRRCPAPARPNDYAPATCSVPALPSCSSPQAAIAWASPACPDRDRRG